MVVVTFLLLPHSIYGWNSTGHMLVARIAWDNLSANERQDIVDLLMKAPSDSCLRELFPTDSRPLAERQRQFFMSAATWPDIIRPKDQNDHRPCIKYHQRDWHFVDHFWSGISGDPNNPPHDLSMPIASVNAAERIRAFRNLVVSNLPPEERAMELAWILHLVGDIHQPLHTSGRVTSSEKKGDGGGNTFKLGTGKKAKSLHSYWDNIIDQADPKHPNEKFNKYLDRIGDELESDFPESSFTLKPGDINAWVLESLGRAKDNAYPAKLSRGHLPNKKYQTKTLEVAQESIAESGYRLANLLSQLF
jgi:hypothetical protein